MTDVRGLTQSVLQTTQMDRVQDAQQRQVNVDQRLAGQQFSQKVDERRTQVNDAGRVENEALKEFEGGAENPDGDTSGSEEAREQEEERQEEAPVKNEPSDPDVGRHIDIKA
jgi:hypothetical protein